MLEWLEERFEGHQFKSLNEQRRFEERWQYMQPAINLLLSDCPSPKCLTVVVLAVLPNVAMYNILCHDQVKCFVDK